MAKEEIPTHLLSAPEAYKRGRQDAAFERRTSTTIIEDALRHAQERESLGGPSAHFWGDEAARMRWVLNVLKDHPPRKRETVVN